MDQEKNQRWWKEKMGKGLDRLGTSWGGFGGGRVHVFSGLGGLVNGGLEWVFDLLVKDED